MNIIKTGHLLEQEESIRKKRRLFASDLLLEFLNIYEHPLRIVSARVIVAEPEGPGGGGLWRECCHFVGHQNTHEIGHVISFYVQHILVQFLVHHFQSGLGYHHSLVYYVPIISAR